MTLSAFDSEKAECAGYLFSILAAAFCSAFQLLAQHSSGISKHLERKSYGEYQYQAHLTMILAPQVLPGLVVFHWLNSCLWFCFVFVIQLGVWYRIRMFQFTFSIIFMAFSKHGMMVILFLINVKLLLWVFCYVLLILKCKIQSLVKARNRNNIYWVSKTWRYLTFCKHFQV